MATLSDDSLEFAKEHIQRFYDSDFFPKPVEFGAIWHFWPEVKKELMSRNVIKHQITPPRAMTIAKARGGFRVVHQLDPLDAIVYTALAFHVAPAIEASRVPAEDRVACSYRLKVADGSFFATGPGYDDFDGKTAELLRTYSHVLVTDISDFYNQIYLHRLNNAIEHADRKLKPFADEVEKFITRLNDKASQGVPVGPAASIVMAEGVLVDVDAYISGLGVAHTRYVDDIRMFSDSPRALRKALEKLTLYLYESHRLSIASEKTFEFNSREFAAKYYDAYAEEKSELAAKLENFNPYAFFEDLDDDEDLDDRLIEAFDQVVDLEHLDLGMARSVIRTARRTKSSAIADALLANLHFFAPVINDVILYLHSIASQGASDASDLLPALAKAIKSEAMECDLARYWMESFLANYPTFMAVASLRQFVADGRNVDNQAFAAVTLRATAWVRQHKSQIANVGGWARRAILNAARVLPGDERGHWLEHVAANSPVPLDRWMARWVAVDAALP